MLLAHPQHKRRLTCTLLSHVPSQTTLLLSHAALRNPGDSTRRHIRAFRLKGYGVALFAICVTLACFITMLVLLRAQQAGVDNLNVVGEWRGEEGSGGKRREAMWR